MRLIRRAPFALRVVERKEGKAGIVYRRKSDSNGRDRLQKLSGFSTLAYTAATPLLRDAVSKSVVEAPASRRGKAQSQGDAQQRKSNSLTAGRFYPLDADWGARVACFAFVSNGLGNADRLIRAAGHLRDSDANEAAWWLGMLTREDNLRPLRALRILTEAVE